MPPCWPVSVLLCALAFGRPSSEWRELRGWVDRLQALKDMHQQESNRLEAHLASGQVALVEAVQIHLDWLTKHIEQLERDIDDHIDRHLNSSAMLSYCTAFRALAIPRLPRCWHTQETYGALPVPRPSRHSLA